MNWVLLLGRFFYSLLFILAGFGHFYHETIDYAAHMGLPMAQFLVPASGVLAILGGLSILLGYRAKIGAWMLVLFLIPVTLTMHQFWNVVGPMQSAMQKAMFFKNLSMLGAALIIAYFGSGPLSIRPKSE